MGEASICSPGGGVPGQVRPVMSLIHFDIFTLFPAMFDGPFDASIIKRAQDSSLISVALHNIRAYTFDKHNVCDDTPYGGGGGMVMKPEPVVRAVETVLSHQAGWSLSEDEGPPDVDIYRDAIETSTLISHVPVILITPQGRLLSQNIAQELSQYDRLALVCGRYEGVDERVRTELVTDEISIGDYVLSGGELAAMVLVDVITRLLPGALGHEQGAHRDSHSPGLCGLLEGPHYTRPKTFRNQSVPEILLSGHHAKIEQWRREQSLLRTLERRPDLLDAARLSPADVDFLHNHGWSSD